MYCSIDIYSIVVGVLDQSYNHFRILAHALLLSCETRIKQLNNEQ